MSRPTATTTATRPAPGPGAEAITQEQFQQLTDLADASGADKVRLAAWLQSSFGIDALAKLPARHFDRVRLMLEDRAKKGADRWLIPHQNVADTDA